MNRASIRMLISICVYIYSHVYMQIHMCIHIHICTYNGLGFRAYGFPKWASFLSWRGGIVRVITYWVV